MTPTVPADIESSPSLPLSRLPCSTGMEDTACLSSNNNTPLKSSLILTDFIPSLIIGIYTILITLFLIWKFSPFSKLTRLVRFWGRKLKRGTGYVRIRGDESGAEDIRRLEDPEQTRHDTRHSGSFTPLFDAAEQLDRNGANGDGAGGATDLSKYFDQITGRLKDGILNSRTKVDTMYAATSPDYRDGSWSGRLEAFLDREILRMQNWLEGGWNGADRVSSTRAGNLHVETAEGQGSGEECGEIRRMLLKYAEEEDEEDADAEEFELHQLGSSGYDPTSLHI